MAALLCGILFVLNLCYVKCDRVMLAHMTFCHAAPILTLPMVCVCVSACVSALLLYVGVWRAPSVADPSESNNLGDAQPHELSAMLARLAHYQTLNQPCCSCTLKPDEREMALPPKEGVWFTFHNQSDPAPEEAPLCAQLREPPPTDLPLTIFRPLR